MVARCRLGVVLCCCHVAAAGLRVHPSPCQVCAAVGECDEVHNRYVGGCCCLLTECAVNSTWSVRSDFLHCSRVDRCSEVCPGGWFVTMQRMCRGSMQGVSFHAGHMNAGRACLLLLQQAAGRTRSRRVLCKERS
jgi:hypothetical protein